MSAGVKTNPEPAKEEKGGAPQPEQAKDENCRCEEASKMSPRQLLGLMMRDLAFWKKPKKS